MFHKVKEVKAIKEYELLITFVDGTIKKYNVEPLFNVWESFQNLKEIPELFWNVKTDLGGYGISWNDEIDLSCNELWENGREQKVL